MSQKSLKNVAASVHQRIVNLARAQNSDVNLLFTRYGLERFLYRLSRSAHADSFVLKGAMLFFVWTGEASRPTRDLDLLAHISPDAEVIRRAFREICRTSVEDDALEFQSNAMEIEATQDLRRFGGFRISMPALLGKVRLQVQVDLGFGDSVTPAPKRITYPTLLGQPAPQLAAYNMETVVAEKTEAIVRLGLTNTRTKDYFDLLMLSRNFAFAGSDLVASLSATFQTRDTRIPADIPPGLSEGFAADPVSLTRWNSFLRRNGLSDNADWPKALAAVRTFVLPPLRATGQAEPFTHEWPGGGPWRPST
jgi:predicted nucleotidyltransferase component of viral defense system